MVKDKDRIFTRYTSLRSDINKYNKHLYYLNNPDKFIQDSIAYVEDSLAIAKEIANVKELQEIWGGLDSLLNVSDTTGYYQDSLKVADTLVVRDSTGILSRDSVFARIRQPERFDSLMAAQFDSMFTNKTFDPEAMRKLEEQKRQNALLASQLTAQLPDTLKFKNNPPRRPSVSKDSLNTLLAKNQLDLGNLFLSELNMADSAYWYYDNSIKNYPATPYYATTLYAIGSYYLTVNDKRRADSLFNIVYDNYKNESIVNAAADKLNKPLIDLEYDPAKIEYLEAENLLLSGGYSEAADAFFTIYEKYPESAFAPKALYTCGWIYENGIHDPVRSVEYYDTLITRYPSSVYVSTIAQKITVYKQDLRKRELALQDSVNAVVTVDSLGADSLFVSEDLVSAEDTIDVAVEDGKEDQLAEEKKKIEEVTVHKTKDPVWNPRRRK
jgi:outer membrane protein assembly factor BamD (BamD/ComL family)